MRTARKKSTKRGERGALAPRGSRTEVLIPKPANIRRLVRRKVAPTLAVRLRMEVADVSPPARMWVARQLCAAARLAGVHGELNIVVVGDRRMAELHEQYKDVPGTTDVLTFDLSGARRFVAGAPIAGDLVLCRDEAKRQAKKRGHATRVELLLYAVHGMLHLCGHDDVTPAKAKRMHRREDELLTALGLGAVFAGD